MARTEAGPLMRCQAQTNTGSAWARPQCSRPAKYPESDPQWCGHHDPERRKARQARSDAKYQSQIDVTRAYEAKEWKRRNLERRAYQAMLDETESPVESPGWARALMDEIRAFEVEGIPDGH